MRYTWLILVMNMERTRKFKVRGEEGQSNKEVYRIAKQKMDEIKTKVKDCTVELISCVQAFKPPEGKIAPKGHVWCPYCIKYRIFTWSERLGVRRCPFCGITENDFHYKKYNGVFAAEKQEWLLNLSRKERAK